MKRQKAYIERVPIEELMPRLDDFPEIRCPFTYGNNGAERCRLLRHIGTLGAHRPVPCPDPTSGGRFMRGKEAPVECPLRQGPVTIAAYRDHVMPTDVGYSLRSDEKGPSV